MGEREKVRRVAERERERERERECVCVFFIIKQSVGNSNVLPIGEELYTSQGMEKGRKAAVV
jgi:hypothetical protein